GSGAGGPDGASGLVGSGVRCPLADLPRSRLVGLRAHIAFARRRGSDAAPALFEAARRLEPLDGSLSRETYLEALGAAIFAGRLSRGAGVGEVAAAARAAPPAPPQPRAADLLLDALACRFTDGYVAGVPPLGRALEAVQEEEDIRWFWLACRVASEIWDDRTWEELATRQVQIARDTGTLAVLPLALVYLSGT